MKKLFAVLLAVLLLLGLTACQSSSSDAELEAMKVQLQLMQQQLDQAKEASYTPGQQLAPNAAATDAPVNNESETTGDESGDLVQALHSTIDGQTSLIIDGAAELVATAVIPEGMAVDYWELNGDQYYEDMEDTFLFTAEGNTVVDARLRLERKITTINAEMQFLDKKGKPRGEEFTEFVFEEDYENPVTKETLPGGWITVNVEAVVPRGYEVDYWLINDVPYYYNRTVTSFKVFDLNEATIYEVVLKKENAPSATPKPTPEPTQRSVTTTAPTQEPVYIPDPTPTPVYYSVSCTFCTFSGGGYSGATGGSVPAGTKITVTADYTGPGYWEGSYVKGDASVDSGVKSFSYTVNSDCSFAHFGIVN